jgi:predicted MFS family arabinose efflux permease
LLALLGLGASFGATALLFLVATVLPGAPTRGAKPTETRTSDAPEEDRRQSNTQAEPIEGLRCVLRDPAIRSLLLIVLGTNLAVMGPLYDGGAVLADSRLRDAGAFGTLVASAGVGSLIGIVSVGSVGGFRRQGPIELASPGLLAFIVAAIAFVPNLAIAVAVAIAIGATNSLLGVVTISWLQERAEPG